MKHIETVHKLQCDSCSIFFNNQQELNTHMLAHNTSNVLNTCHHCEMIIKDNLYLICDKCDFSYHKKCTQYKSSGGNWKPKTWLCEYCSTTTFLEKPSTTLEMSEQTKKLTNFGGKHRKSNVNSCDHPEIEFMESQINTLKTVVAKREAELKKVQESDNLKAKRIMNLEAQLNEARKTACFQNLNSEDLKITNLENKTSCLEEQVILLTSKFETFQSNMEKPSNTKTPFENPKKIYSCDTCDMDFCNKGSLKNHKDTYHQARQIFACEICDRNFGEKSALKEHTRNEHEDKTEKAESCNTCDMKFDDKESLNIHKENVHTKNLIFSCDNCDYKTKSKDDFHEHGFIHTLQCPKCSYKAIHWNDMRRHKTSMHAIQPLPCSHCSYTAIHSKDLRRHQATMHACGPLPCPQCSYKAVHEIDLTRHQNTMHVMKQPNSKSKAPVSQCQRCDFNTDNTETMNNHIQKEHHQHASQRTQATASKIHRPWQSPHD